MNARIYLRVSTKGQDLERQESIIQDAISQGYYVAGVYRETASGARADRPELLRLLNDLQFGDVVIAEKMDRISRLPLTEAEKLIESIKSKGAVLSIPGVVDLSDITASTDGIAKIVLESIQQLMLKLSLQMARDDYEDRRKRQRQGIQKAKENGKYKGRTADHKTHELIIKLRPNHTIEETARLVGCSKSQVKLIWSKYQKLVS
ncbi:resolvase [Pokkaliibacter plantistimulans]|uniref:Resolvase n=1 Tax=Pokkaliibacter plantistimulans TaxID=1635171 RepID=A0ABX5LZI7_9GAMM|nr:recombinase family protein [Pokkaliibacter plantistimulans]PXF32095.1 resolvase [Pokkaliibacter plantistimulans]